MSADRYLRFILTIIAAELLWLGVRDIAPAVLAQPKPAAVTQQKSEPMAVVITGIRIGQRDYTTLPVAIVGSVRPDSISGGRELPAMQPLGVRVTDPVQAEIRQPLGVIVGNQPLTVQTGPNPLVVDVLPGKPSARPGF